MNQASETMDQETDDEDEDLRLAFRADGGRIGFRGEMQLDQILLLVEMQVGLIHLVVLKDHQEEEVEIIIRLLLHQLKFLNLYKM